MPIPKFITDRYTSVSSGAGPTQPSLDWGNIAKDLGAAAAIYGIVNPNDSSGLANFFGTGGRQQPIGYTGGIPNYTATRELAPNAFAQTYTTPTGEVAPRRPGAAGRRYFTDTTFTQDTGTPFMGITAEQIAAQNQAALDEQALFESILGGVETKREAAATTPTGGITTPTGGITTPTGGTTTPTGGITTPTGGITTPTGGTTTPTGGTTTDSTYTNFVNQFAGRRLTAEDAAALAGSGYSLNQLATSFGVDPTELRTFVNYYTDGYSTTDDGLVGTTGMANLLVSLGGTRNADGTITDRFGTTYSVQDGAWRPVTTTTTDTTTTDTTTTDTTTTDSTYTNFVNQFAGKELTPEDAAALAGSGYSLNQLATSFGVDPTELRTFVNYYTDGYSTTDDGTVGTTGMGNLLVSLGGTRNADGTITDRFGTTYSVQDGAWRPVSGGGETVTDDTTGTTTTDTTTTDTTTTDTTTTGTTGTTGTTTTGTTDAVDTLLNATEQILVANNGWIDNGDGTLTTPSGRIYNDGVFSDAVTTDNTTVTDDTTNNTFTLNAADGTTSTIDLTDRADTLITTGTATPTDGPLAPSFDMVDASDGLSTQEQDIIYSVMTTSGANIADVAEEFDVSQLDVIEGLLRGGYETPEQIATTLSAASDTDFSEEQLIANLLETNKTTPEEVAAYYGIPVSAVTARYRELGGTKFAQGGNVNGYYLGGSTDGMADQIPATINNMQPAALSDGEFVIPADVVSHLGNGNSDAGAQNLYSMMERVRKDRTGNPKQGKQINPNKYLA